MACSLKGTVCEALILVVDPTYKMLAATRVKLSAWLNCQIFLDNVTLKCDLQNLFRRIKKKKLIVEQRHVSKSYSLNSSHQGL